MACSGASSIGRITEADLAFPIYELISKWIEKFRSVVHFEMCESALRGRYAKVGGQDFHGQRTAAQCGELVLAEPMWPSRYGSGTVACPGWRGIGEMSTLTRILQQVETLDARAKEESNPSLGIQAAKILEMLAAERSAERFSYLTQALSLRLSYALCAYDTLVSFQQTVFEIECGQYPHIATKRLARQTLDGVLTAHERKLQKPMVAWRQLTNRFPKSKSSLNVVHARN